MHKKRIIARLDIKNDSVIKGIHLEGLRKVGHPNEMAFKYYLQGVDEIVFMDAVAAYYDRNSLSHIIEQSCKNIFVPITVGGGLRNLEDIQSALNSGADKVAINTKAIAKPDFITDASSVFGTQCIVVSIVAKQIAENEWEAYMDNGREPTGINAVEWACEVQKLGAGEILLTSLDREGTRKGFHQELFHRVRDVVSIPIIGCGGAGSTNNIVETLQSVDIDGVAVASILHYGITTVDALKKDIYSSGIPVRV